MPKSTQLASPETLRELLHKLNNDLSLVLGYIDLAARAAQDSPVQVSGRLSAAKEAVQRMAGSISAAQKAWRE